MKNLNQQITSISDDLLQVFVNAYGEKTDMIRLCRDHHDPFLHKDKKPVLNITQDEFVGIFNTKSNRYFLPGTQIFRLGTYCSLPLPNLIAFILKADWENYLLKMEGISLESISGLTNLELIGKYLPGFKPTTSKIFNLFRKNPELSSFNSPYSMIDFYIDDLMEKSSFLLANKNISKLYSEKEVPEEMFLHTLPNDQKESYLRYKDLWLTKSTELDDILLYIERKKRLNTGLENKYFRLFGNIEAERSKLECRLEKYRIMLENNQKYPGLSLRDLIKSADDKLTEAKRLQSEISNKISRSMNRIDFTFTDNSHETVSEEFKNSYMQECKKLLRKLFFILHTDTCPNYADLPGNKKAQINKLWLKLMKSTKEDIYSFSPSMLLYSLPDYEQLKSIYERACVILGIDPDCYETGNRLEFMIKKGSSIESVIGFLKSEIEQLELHLARLELIQNEYTNEEQANIYRQAMEDINGHTVRLKNKISEIRKQILNLKKQLSEKLAKIA